MAFKTPRFALVLAAAAMLLVGCGGSDYTLAPVSGTLTIDGKPYPGGRVIFAPTAKGEDLVAGRSSFGITNQQGQYSLNCYSENDGAIVGEHTVTFFRAEDDSTSRPDLKGFSFQRITLPASASRLSQALTVSIFHSRWMTLGSTAIESRLSSQG